ncbi:glycoside hydrolase family 2 TIM barrel-domain containing protein [Faecalimonas sp.]
MKRKSVLKRMFCGALATIVALGMPSSVVIAKNQVKDERHNQIFPVHSSQTEEVKHKIVENKRQNLNFNTDWLYIEDDDLDAINPQYDESKAKSISLPHAREPYDLFEPNMEKVQSVNWYRRHFTLPQEKNSGRVFVEFNGGGQINRVYVNGALVGEAKGTFTHFKFDITDYVAFGDYDNVISVQVDSRYHKDELPPGKNIDFHYFGGLHGEAKMILTDDLYSESVFYYNDDVKNGCQTAILNGWIDVSNKYASNHQVTIKSIVKDKDGKIVSTTEKQAEAKSNHTEKVQLKHEIDSPHLWSPDHPYLYTVETQILMDKICVDNETTTVGIRTLKASKVTDKEGKFYLNGEPIKVIGGNWHMQAPYLGNSKTAKLNAKDAEILKRDLGINFVRTSHYEADPSFLDACDRLGIMVEEEPLGWNDTPGWEQFCYSMDAMIKRDRNHASIVLWSVIPNERPVNFPSIEEGKKRNIAAKNLDPSRLTIQEEMNNSAVIADVYGWHDYDNPDTNTIKNNPNTSSWFVTEWNTNLGKHFVIPGDSETRKNNQVIQDGKKLGLLNSDPRVMGTLKWDLFGYYTPQTAYERGKNVDLWRSSGVYGIWRNPLHKTWIADLISCQSPNSKNVKNIIKIASEWKSDSSKTIRVITNMDEVELYYDNGNGELRSVRRMDKANEYENILKKGIFCFENTGIIWNKNSKLVAKGYKKGIKDAVVEDVVYASTYDCEADGASVKLHNTIGNIEADGSDVAWILAELKDKNGQREFYGDEIVNAKIISGPGKLVYARNNPVMVDGISGFYLQSEKDKTGTTKIQTDVDLGINKDDDSVDIIYEGAGWEKLQNRQDAYQGTLHETTKSGDSVTIKFKGTQIVVYSESNDKNGEAVVTLDGKQVGKLSCKNIEKYNTIANQVVYRSDELENREHTLTITVSKGKVNLDRVKVFDGRIDASGIIEVNTLASNAERVKSCPELPDANIPQVGNIETLKLLLEDAKKIENSNYTVLSALELEDAIVFGESVVELKEPSEAIISKALKVLQNAIGHLVRKPVSTITHKMTVMEGQSGGVAYVSSKDKVWVAGNDNTFANKERTTKDYYSITFKGVMIELFSTLDNAHGVAAISIDDGPEIEINQYRAQQEKNALFWKSDTLEYGTHTVKVRVTGKSGGNNQNACISFESAKIYESIDELEEAREMLDRKLKEVKKIERSEYSKSSLEKLDSALFDAENVLKDVDATLKQVNEAFVQLTSAYNDLSVEATGSNVITCLDDNKASGKGELNKIYYVSKSENDWVLENATNEELRNRYLKKNATNPKDAYASVTFEGTQVEVFARFSQTSGLARIELYDKNDKLIESKEIDLYDGDIGAGQGSTRQAYKSKELENGKYTLKLVPKNEKSPANPNAGITSINISKVIVTKGEKEVALDTTKLENMVTALNKVDLKDKHSHAINSFYVNLNLLLKQSYGLITGEWPRLVITKDLPVGMTNARIDKVTTEVKMIFDKVNEPIIVKEVEVLKDITAEQGTSIPFPKQAFVVSSDEQREKVTIAEWTCDKYSENKPGEYLFEGSLLMPKGMENPEEHKAKVRVTVKKGNPKPPEECQHVYGEWKIIKEAMCTQNGLKEKVCLKCGHKVTEEILMLGHNFGEWIVVKQPTKTEEGLKERKCSRNDCTYKESEVIAKVLMKEEPPVVNDYNEGETEKSPETGDAAMILFIVMSMVMCLSVIIAIIRRKAVE